MGIQPEHAQLFAPGPAVLRNGADRSDGQAMVAAQQHWQMTWPREFFAKGVEHQPVPGHDRLQMPVALRAGRVRRCGAVEVAAVMHRKAPRGQCFHQPRDADGFGAHGRAAHGCAHIGGCTHQYNLRRLHGAASLWLARARWRAQAWTHCTCSLVSGVCGSLALLSTTCHLWANAARA